jgi:hypothetical protein
MRKSPSEHQGGVQLNIRQPDLSCGAACTWAQVEEGEDGEGNGEVAPEEAGPTIRDPRLVVHVAKRRKLMPTEGKSQIGTASRFSAARLLSPLGKTATDAAKSR